MTLLLLLNPESQQGKPAGGYFRPSFGGQVSKKKKKKKKVEAIPIVEERLAREVEEEELMLWLFPDDDF